MTPDDHQRVIDELQTLIEEAFMDDDKLLAILGDALKQQREHT